MLNETGTFRDASLPVDDRIKDLLGRLTLDEKVSQMVNVSPAIERLGIPAYDWWNECLHGVARAGRATVFPQAIGMAATFNPELIGRVATAISDEARAKHHAALAKSFHDRYFGLTHWSPNVNIFRDPRWGRGHETYGEDPYLSGRLGVEFCKGLQGDDPKYLKLVATPKHYAVHSGPELERHTFNAVVSKRDMHETYLPAFKACVQEGKAVSVMGAYNRTNGEVCCGSPTLLQKILRDDWGFDGYVVSDCGAICDFHAHHKVCASPAESAALAVRNGCELNCGSVFPHLVKAVDLGLISEAEIDRALGRLLRARFRLGMFDPPERVPYASISTDVVECPGHRELARETARQSMVLLKNAGGTLPLDRNANRFLVVGPNAYSLRTMLGDYYGFSGKLTSPLEGIVDAVSTATDVQFTEGCGLFDDDDSGIGMAVLLAESSGAVIACMGISPLMEGEEGEVAMSDGGGDRLSIDLPGRQEELLKAMYAKNPNIVLVLFGGSCIALSDWVRENIPAILLAWYPGEEGGNALADVLFGDCSPGGRLPVTFEPSLDVLPPFRDYAMKGRTYRFADHEPQYPFGYGLSYTSFRYSNLRLDRDAIAADDDGVAVSVEVENTGEREGDEVVQLYVRDVAASMPVPLHQLQGVRRIRLKSGETSTVEFDVRTSQLVCYDEDGEAFVEPGVFRIFVGGGQPEFPQSGAVSVDLTVK